MDPSLEGSMGSNSMRRDSKSLMLGFKAVNDIGGDTRRDVHLFIQIFINK